LVHTYHGHSLAGYFSPRVTAVYRGIEQILARFTACLVAVSTEVRDELLAMRVAPESKFEVVPLGFDLAPFRLNAEPRRIARDGLRDELGLRHDDRIVTLIARCVPIKRVDRFLRLATALRDVPGVRFLVVGDGELRAELQTSPEALALGGRLVWAGFRSDIPDVCFASDVVVLTSDNEGTPVSLIEAQAAGTPVVSTDVGGVATVIRDGETGFVVDPEDEQGMADLVARLLADPELAARLGAAGAHHAMKFTIAGLVERIDDLYQRLLGLPAPATVPAPAAADAEPQPVEI
jgi:glycosyltransferase involved in cell wall biosynthesis